MSFYYCLL